MIDTVTIAGAVMDPCWVLAQVTVMHGRGGFGEAGQPASATVTVEYPQGSMPPWQSGDSVTLDGPDGRLFAGRIVQRSLGHLEDSDGGMRGQFTMTAAGPLAALGVRKIGDVPWPQETGTQRAAHILAASGVSAWYVDGDTDLVVLPRDVDAQPAAGLLDELAVWTSGAVFDTPAGEVVYQPLDGRSRPVVPFMWSDFDPAATWDQFPAGTWNGDPPSIGQWPSPKSTFPVPLPCDAVEWEPVWVSSESTVINHVRVGYGALNPQDTVELEDAASITRHNRRYLYLGTQLATVADANARAAQILTTQAAERWQIDEVTVHLDLLPADVRADCLRLLCGDQVTLSGLPQPAPATDWTGIVEGWTYTQYAEGDLFTARMSLQLSEPLLSLAVMQWADYPGTYLWSEHPAYLTWGDILDETVLEAA